MAETKKVPDNFNALYDAAARAARGAAKAAPHAEHPAVARLAGQCPTWRSTWTRRRAIRCRSASGGQPDGFGAGGGLAGEAARNSCAIALTFGNWASRTSIRGSCIGEHSGPDDRPDAATGRRGRGLSVRHDGRHRSRQPGRLGRGPVFQGRRPRRSGGGSFRGRSGRARHTRAKTRSPRRPRPDRPLPTSRATSKSPRRRPAERAGPIASTAANGKSAPPRPRAEAAGQNEGEGQAAQREAPHQGSSVRSG